MTIVNTPSTIIVFAPSFIFGASIFASNSGLECGTTNDNKNAVTKYPITDAGKRYKKSAKSPFPEVQTISVVISPKGDHAPPAFAATTIFIAPGTKNSFFVFQL